MSDADVIIIGSGIGGATMAASLADTGKRILILERGDHLRPSVHDRSDRSIFVDGHYRPDEQWLDGAGKPFDPGNYYYVGGNSKFYGAVLIRYRREDFSPLGHLGGTTPGWPISYDDLEPYYCRAESLYSVRGHAAADPTTSVVDTTLRSHDHPNLYITDASVLPTSAAVNPALTIAALSIRTAEHIARHG